MKLSLCMILKNEGPTIYKCLDSMKSFVDEWIIGIDDSTSDNTEKEVTKFFKDCYDMPFSDKPMKIGHDYGLYKKQNEFPKLYNVILYKYKWQDNFSKARNEEMDKATGTHILIMDGHEYFPESWYNITEGKRIPVLQVMQKVKQDLGKKEIHETFFHLYQQPFVGEIPNNFFLQPRIYLNGPGKDGKTIMRFNRGSHNTIINSDPEKHIQYPEVVIVHDAPAENRTARKKQRVKVNIINLKKDIQKNNKDTRAYFYLGNTYMEAKKWASGVRMFDKYLKYRTDDNTEKYQVLIHKALCLKELKDWDKMSMALHHAVKVENLRRDAYCLLAELYNANKQYDRALGYINNALSVKPMISRMFSNGSVQTFQPHVMMSTIYEKLGDKVRAVSHLKLALRYVRNQPWLDKIKELEGKGKNVFIIDSIGSFTEEYEKHLKGKGYNVIKQKTYNPSIAMWANYIWQEWCDGNAVESAKHMEKTTIRLHGYEAYLNKGLFNQIQWNRVKTVFVAKHIQEMMNSFVNGTGQVIKNGVNCERFFIKKHRDNKNIGYAGLMNEKKNPYLLLKIIKDNPDYIFNLRIDHQSPFWEETFKYELKDCKNIVYHARYKDLNDFWNQMSGVLSTSIIESFSYNIAEGMAAGCRPYIYNWKGSKDIWNEEFIFTDMPEFKEHVSKDEREEHRNYILENYNLQGSLEAMEKVMIK